MTKDSPDVNLHSVPKWLVDWINSARQDQNRHSLFLSTPRGEHSDLAHSLTHYLNEFDSDCDSNWRPFDRELLNCLASDSSSRRIVLATETDDELCEFPEADIEQVARRLLKLGSAVLQTHHFELLSPGATNVFQVILHHGEAPAGIDCHMTINLTQVSAPESLTSIIADSFLGWRSSP